MADKSEAQGRGVAGPASDAGKEAVRSDVRCVFEARTHGELMLDIKSKVAPYYGKAIRAQAEAVLRELGVTHGALGIDDQGALPYVIAARIEAAVKRAGCGEGRRAPCREHAPPPPTKRERLRRSRLYLPGNQPKLFLNAGLHGPDAVILDLEDSVHPREKDAARLLVRNALMSVDFYRAERMVRINQLPLGLADLDEVIPAEPDLILIPKVETPEQVAAVSERIDEILAERGGAEARRKRPVWLMPILESALGIENAYAIAKASSQVVALTLGLEDLTADLGVVKTPEGSETLFARMRVVNAARAAGVQAIDSVYGDVGDLAGLAAWGHKSRALGFEGMGCIHPRQIPVIHQAFAPSEAELGKALKIVAAFTEAEKNGLGVVSLGTKMIDPPVVLRAQKLVALAESMGMVLPRPEVEKSAEASS